MYFALASLLLGIVTLVLYVREILASHTRPHEFTWLIWAVTQGSATAIMWYGGGGFGALYPSIGTVFIVGIFVLLLFRGSRDITTSDIVVLTLALGATSLWWFTKNPFYSLYLLTGIDLAGYIPTFRKTYLKPYAEKIVFWLLFFVIDVLSILAIDSYNVLTLLYLSSIAAANLLLVLWLLWRRRVLALPS